MVNKLACFMSSALNAKKKVYQQDKIFVSLDQFIMSMSGYQNMKCYDVTRSIKDYADQLYLPNWMHFTQLIEKAGEKLAMAANTGMLINDLSIKYIFEVKNNDGDQWLGPDVKFVTFDTSPV